jgi:uncharacterized protein YdhG (YjbR/CyaY superfamily)
LKKHPGGGFPKNEGHHRGDAQRETAMTDTKKSTRSRAATDQPAEGFTEEEQAAIKDRAQEVRAAKRRGGGAGKADEEGAVLAKIAELTESDRVIAERLHAVITASAPDLSPKLWYGMPAYARDGKVVCFFQSAEKFKSRYATLGFNDAARLDDGEMWPTAFALTKLTPAVERRISALVKSAVS